MALLSSDREPEVPMEDVRGRCGVRRNLFGPIDHQQLEQDFQRLMRTSVDTATRRWNFDFLSDRPAPGSAHLEWEALRCQDVPEFYHSSVVTAGSSSSPGGSASSCSSSPSCSPSAGSPQRSSRGVKRGISSLSNIAMETRHKQATITDFFTVRKRRRLHMKVMTRQ